MVDHDVAVIDPDTLTTVDYLTNQMNICMAVGVRPDATGADELWVVGTEADNLVRFEPVLNGRFVTVRGSATQLPTLTAGLNVDLNPHLTYSSSSIPQAQRDLSIGDPRAIVWNAAGSEGYVAGLGSNNVIRIDAQGARLGTPIEVGDGPTGLVLDEATDRLFVFCRFSAQVDAIDLTTNTVVDTVPLFDPTPSAIRVGRRHLFDTHETSGLGHVSCASCHVDSRTDRLAWDLGDPSAPLIPVPTDAMGAPVASVIDGGVLFPWHPAKGALLTQTLQDIIGKEPFHWRGDRLGLEEFNVAFEFLLGDDEQLTATEMQEFEDYLETITFPPNPYRTFENGFSSNVPLSGRYDVTTPTGDAQAGLALFQTGEIAFGDSACERCHSVTTGLGSDGVFNQSVMDPQIIVAPVGPDGEHHHAISNNTGFADTQLKIPHLRNLYDRVGFDANSTASLAGFGFRHSGSVDTLERFLTGDDVFDVTPTEARDLAAFLMSFSGSGVPRGPGGFGLLGVIPAALSVPSNDTHAAIGEQVSFSNSSLLTLSDLDTYLVPADNGDFGVIVKGHDGVAPRGFVYRAGTFASDRCNETYTSAGLLNLVQSSGQVFTLTVVPLGMESLLGIDRDGDGALDRDELDSGSDPDDPTDIGFVCPQMLRGDKNLDGSLDISDAIALLNDLTGPADCPDIADDNDDGFINIADPISLLSRLFGSGPPLSVCDWDATPDTLNPCVSYSFCP